MPRIPEIVFEDDYVMVVNKPSRMLVIPAPRKKGAVLTDLLNKTLAQRGLSVKAHPCHRIDYDTSGLVIFAKGKKAQQAIMEQFHRFKVDKKYIAFVQGYPKRRQGEIKGLISDMPGRKPHRLAITRYRVLERRKDFSIVEVEPVTGRTNQIRIQFKKIGHPVVGERRFAFARDYALKFRRTALHSARIGFTHPVTGEPLQFSVPLPADMQGLCPK